MWIQREIEATLLEISKVRPALILTGCRQAGKTSLLQRVFPNYRYVSMDLPLIAAEAEEAGDQFLKDHPSPMIIDEIQYAPLLFRYLKGAIDQKRDRNSQYLLTGSQKFPLMQKVTESLAGRVSVLDCHSLSVKELERWKGEPAEGNRLIESIFKGGYPELHAKALSPERFFSDYLSTYLERDVRQILHVKNLRDFNRFMKLIAVRTSQLLSLTTFASDLGVSPNTIKSWLSVLEASNIIILIEPFYRNLGKRLIKTPKLYFLDTGLACYLSGMRSASDLKKSPLFGAFFETHVLSQMVRWYANLGKKPDIYFYRDVFGHEVDFVIPVGMKLKLMECKWSELPKIPKGFEEIGHLIGDKNILTKSVITSARGSHYFEKMGIFLEDSIELQCLGRE